MEAVDLTNVPIVDNHYHRVAMYQTFAEVVAWRRAFTESTDPGMPREHVATTAFYRHLIRSLSRFLEWRACCAGTRRACTGSSTLLALPAPYWSL